MTTPIYTDLSSLAELRRQARGGDQEAALRQVAAQFEAMFMQMMLKSMREASFGDPLFDSSQGDFYRDLFDRQMSLTMSQGRGLGLADMLVQQLRGGVSGRAQPAPAAPLPRPAAAANPDAAPTAREVHLDGTPEGFVQALWPLAERTGRRLGVAPQVLLAQAALETGWGRAVIRRPDGASSFNLFNIKADGRWPGERVAIDTLEYEAGVPVRRRAAFRAYDSYAQSFEDYAAFLTTSGRYAQALQRAGDGPAFVQALQDAGYATDPEYASKIKRLLGEGPLARAAALKNPDPGTLSGVNPA